MATHNRGAVTRWARLAGAAGTAGVLALLAARALAPDPFRKGNGMKAPELDGGAAWLNTEKALRLADLKGKIVLLDFWTFG